VRRKLLSFCAALALGAGGFGASQLRAQGEGPPPEQASMRGLKAVQVLIEPLPAEVEKAGLTTAALQGEVESRLASGGIRVLKSERDQLDDVGNTLLYLNVEVLPETLADPPLTYACMLELRQDCVLIRNPKIQPHAITWSTASVIRGGDAPSIRARVGARVDQFLKDWRAENR
jgi:hypothetical protein